ncbi:MAG: peptidyl-prolyl cis-trans isomerase, partial [Candidatus Cloacimonetes bacterium]|nr:peptidyl-prolyl cis-trans isomerase [Candidatus Cloacimonadota bacterium]
MSSHTLKIGLIIIIALSLFTLFSEEVSTPVTDENRLSDNDILAEFNGGKILRKDLDAKISKLPPQIQGRYKTVDSQIQILDIMATEDVFFAEAISRNIDKDPIVLERLDRAKRQFFIQEYYKRFVADAVVITEQAREKYYSDNIKSFFISPYLSINYIQAENEVAALAALNELKAGTPFEEVSEKYNQNTYAKGLKGKVKNIRLNGQIPGVGDDPELDAYISQSTVDPNTFHGPYQTKTGWHIFSTLERVEGRQRPYAEVADDINSRLRPVMEKELLDMIVENLKQKYSVTVDTLLVKDLNLQEKVTDENILNKKLVDSPNADLVFTVRQILDIYSKMPPQEQMFHSKSGANSLITQELSRNLMFLDSEGRNFETVLENNEDYIQTKRYHILQEAYKRLVVDAIQV